MNTDQSNPESEDVETVEAHTETMDTEDNGERTKAGREAAKYRRQLREVETHRDQLLAQVSAFRDDLLASVLSQRINVGSHREDMQKLQEPSDLFTVGKVNRDDLFNDDNTLNTDRLQDAARALYETRPSLFLPMFPPPDPAQGAHGYDNAPAGTTQFVSAFGPQL